MLSEEMIWKKLKDDWTGKVFFDNREECHVVIIKDEGEKVQYRVSKPTDQMTYHTSKSMIKWGISCEILEQVK